MKNWLVAAVASGCLGIGCSVPETTPFTLERFCQGGGSQTMEGLLRVDPSACDRGLELIVQPKGFNPGCIRVALWTKDGSGAASTVLLRDPQTSGGAEFHAVALLSDALRAELRLEVDAFAQDCDTAPVTSQAFIVAQPEKGQIAQSLIELSALDADGDGFFSKDTGGTDCDDSNFSIKDKIAWYPDMDGDGYGSSSSTVPVARACSGPSQTANNNKDCNDNAPLVWPGQAEVRCDGRDDNCDGRVDEAFNVGTFCWLPQGKWGVSACDPVNPARALCTSR
ncbi:putative metal-binding motif-containing protein [Corallococcus interemptor]|uniref:putative metal-binding motif-containing protein n=1 Tax=Corallococcus interemptor TaxID=2316720 RepID=UPI003CFDBBF4